MSTRGLEVGGLLVVDLKRDRLVDIGRLHRVLPSDWLG
jgi:hypothetical protein